MSADARHNALLISVFVLMIPLVIILVSNLEGFPAVYDEAQANALANPVEIVTNIANWDWTSLVSISSSVVVFAVAVFRLAVGAAVFAIAFAFLGTYIANLLNFLGDFGLSSDIAAIITLSLDVMFIYAFIRLAST